MTAELEQTLRCLPKSRFFDAVPAPLRAWLLPTEWDRKALWSLDLPTEQLPIAELTWHLSLPWWRDGDTLFQVSPIDVLHQPTRYPEHVTRTNASDARFPLHVIRRRDRWLILDGIHRLLKAHQLGVDAMAVKPLLPAHLTAIATGEANLPGPVMPAGGGVG